MTERKNKRKFLKAGEVFISQEGYEITTILGSCVSVCLWDTKLGIGGMNHYLLPLWNGEGLSSPRYGNIAIKKLIQKMESLGCRRKDLVAKVFGGASVLQHGGKGYLEVGQRNIVIAKDMLKEEKIRVISSDVDGELGRKIIFDTADGGVMVKMVQPMKKAMASVR